MIKRIFLVLIVAVSFLQMNAQSNEFKRELSLGIGFGPTFSNLSLIQNGSQRAVRTKNIMQFHGGLSLRYITEKNFGLIGELNYSQMGWQGEFEEGSTYEHTHKLNYLEMPLLTHIYFGSNKARFFINLGPKIGFLISDKETLNDELQSWVDDQIAAGTVDSSNPYLHYNKEPDNKIDYGLMAGLGFEWRSKFGNFALEGRYYMGFSDIYSSAKEDDFSRSANRVISARLTYYMKPF